MHTNLENGLSTLLVAPIYTNIFDKSGLCLNFYDSCNGGLYYSIKINIKHVGRFINSALNYLEGNRNTRYVSVCFIDRCIKITDGLWSGGVNLEVRLDRKQNKVKYKMHSILWDNKKSIILTKPHKSAWPYLFNALYMSQSKPSLYVKNTSADVNTVYEYKKGRLLEQYEILFNGFLGRSYGSEFGSARGDNGFGKDSCVESSDGNNHFSKNMPHGYNLFSDSSRRWPNFNPFENMDLSGEHKDTEEIKQSLSEMNTQLNSLNTTLSSLYAINKEFWDLICSADIHDFMEPGEMAVKERLAGINNGTIKVKDDDELWESGSPYADLEAVIHGEDSAESESKKPAVGAIDTKEDLLTGVFGEIKEPSKDIEETEESEEGTAENIDDKDTWDNAFAYEEEPSDEPVIEPLMKNLELCTKLQGKIISFEGGEGAGKSTQIQYLKRNLELSGFKVACFREPGGSRIAEQIRNLILDKGNADMDTMCEALCFAAARAQLFNEKIMPALKDNYVVLLDRYVDTSYVYQGMVKGLGLEVVRTINNFAINNVLPACTFYFDIDPEEGLRRIHKNGRETNKFEEVDISFHKKVRSCYKKLAQSKRYAVIDASKDREAVYDDIVEVLLERFSL